MNENDLPEALRAPPTQEVRLALGHILADSGLTPGELVPALYDPGNREVLDLLHAGAGAPTISNAWDRLHPHTAQAVQVQSFVHSTGELITGPEPPPENTNLTVEVTPPVPAVDPSAPKVSDIRTVLAEAQVLLGQLEQSLGEQK